MNIRICPKCGGKIAKSRLSCPHCSENALDTKVCPECEELITSQDKECPVCGHVFEAIDEDSNKSGFMDDISSSYEEKRTVEEPEIINDTIEDNYEDNYGDNSKYKKRVIGFFIAVFLLAIFSFIVLLLFY